MPLLNDILHVYPSQPNAILFHLQSDNHLDVLSRGVYQFIVGALYTFKRWLSFKIPEMDFISIYFIQSIAGFEGESRLTFNLSFVSPTVPTDGR